jgi:hypothetical protein
MNGAHTETILSRCFLLPVRPHTRIHQPVSQSISLSIDASRQSVHPPNALLCILWNFHQYRQLKAHPAPELGSAAAASGARLDSKQSRATLALLLLLLLLLLLPLGLANGSTSTM